MWRKQKGRRRVAHAYVCARVCAPVCRYARVCVCVISEMKHSCQSLHYLINYAYVIYDNTNKVVIQPKGGGELGLSFIRVFFTIF